jgi:hypothetical protein
MLKVDFLSNPHALDLIRAMTLINDVVFSPSSHFRLPRLEGWAYCTCTNNSAVTVTVGPYFDL